MDYLTVTLSNADMMQAAVAGTLRQISALQRDRKTNHGAHETQGRWENEIIGSIAEFAIARLLGIFWDGTVGLVDTADVGEKVEVRGTAHPRGGLIVHKPPPIAKDKPESPFVCVRVVRRDCIVIGWLWGVEAQKAPYWRDLQPKRPCYRPPDEILRPFDPKTFLTEVSFGCSHLLEAANGR